MTLHAQYVGAGSRPSARPLEDALDRLEMRVHQGPLRAIDQQAWHQVKDACSLLEMLVTVLRDPVFARIVENNPVVAREVKRAAALVGSERGAT
jgi:hypothetical protein